MKLTLTIFVFCLAGAAASTYSQITRLDIKMENGNMVELIKQIEAKSEFLFYYQKDELSEMDNLTVEAQNATVMEILDEATQGTAFDYTVIDRYIVVRKDGNNFGNDILATAKENAAAQQPAVSGKVTDASNQPLPGVTVVVKGTTQGTVTNTDGNYTLANIPENATLVFSFVGMRSQEVPIGNQTSINVEMEVDAIGIEEVVAVGYGTQRKVNLTGAIDQVEVDEIIRNRPLSNIATALQGEIPGLQITSGSGIPGEKASIRIRGIMSITGGDPLILVDNIPMDIEDLNPADIETISVLKDASSASIYGGRAAFGVVLITTKKGLRNQPIKVNYTSNITTSRPSELPKQASTMEMITALKDFGNYSWWSGQDLAIWENLLAEYQIDPEKYPEGETMVNGVTYRLAEEELFKKIFTNSFEQLHNLSFSGGLEKSSYRVSLGYADEDGILITDKDSYEKFNVNTYLNIDLTNKLVSTLNILYKRDSRFIPANFSFGRWSFGKHVDFGYYTDPDDDSTMPFYTPNNTIELERPDNDVSEDLRIFEKLEYQIMEGLKVIGEYTFNKSILNSDRTRTTNVYMGPETYTPEPINFESSYNRSNANTDYNALNLYATYEKKYMGHEFGFLAGTNQEQSKYSYFTARRTDLLSKDVPSLATASGTMTNDESFDDYNISGYFARLNYIYKDKILFEANMRYDGSSKFPKGDRYGLFPSFSAGWVVTEESFMKPIENIINFMKIRSSWGEIGNQNIPNYSFIPGMNTYNASWIDPASTIRFLTVAPPELVSSSFTWETVRTKNIGVDMSFFNRRLTATFDYFNRETLDMLGPASELPAVLGTPAPLKNVADLVSKGWEGRINWKVIKKDFGYSFGINVADDRGFITKFKNEAGLLSQYYDGYEFGEIWGYETYGFYTVEDFVPGTLDANLMGGELKEGIPAFHTTVITNPGDIRFVDLDSDGEISTGSSTLSDPGDRKIIGNDNRRYQFGITGNCFYKNFDFSFLIQGVGKRDVWIDDPVFWPYRGQFDAFYKHQLDYWIPENTDAFYPRSYIAAGGNTATSRNIQTKYLSNGAYIRLKNIELSYRLPSSMVEKLSMEHISLFVSVENLLKFDHVPDGIDPELDSVTRGHGYPYIKKISFGVDLSF